MHVLSVFMMFWNCPKQSPIMQKNVVTKFDGLFFVRNILSLTRMMSLNKIIINKK